MLCYSVRLFPTLAKPDVLVVRGVAIVFLSILNDLALILTPTPKLIPRLHDDGAVRNGSAWQGTEQLSSNVYTRFWLCGIEWFFKSNSVVSLPEIKMDALFTTFRAIEKRRHQMHKRRAIIFSRFSRNIHNIMAMAIQYTSNGLSTDLVVHQLIFFTSIPLPKSLSTVCFVV